MIADQKKCQTLINAAAEAAEDLKLAAARLETLRTLFNAANPSVVGTPLQGNLNAVSTWIDNVRSVADSAVADGMIAAKVPSHRGEAL